MRPAAGRIRVEQWFWWLSELPCRCSWWTAVCVLLCVAVQVYESKLQELQKQVETRSLVAETPDEEELEEEEEEEGVYDWVL